MTKDGNKEIYELFCKDRFRKIEDKLDNEIPHQINALFWKMLGTIIAFSGVVLAVVKLWK